MNLRIFRHPWRTASFLVLLIIVPYFFILKYPMFEANIDNLSWICLFDLGITFPTAMYWFVIRKRYSLKMIIPVWLSSLGVAYFLLPKDFIERLDLDLLDLVIVFELTMMVLVVKKIPVLIRNYRELKQSEPHLLSRLETSLAKTLGKRRIWSFMVTDLLVFYYGLFCWRKKYKFDLNLPSFTLHQKSSLFTLIGFVAFILMFESIALHFLLLAWNEIASWIVTALDIYSLLFLIAQAHAVRLSPIIFNQGFIHIQYGLLYTMKIPYASIQEIRKLTTNAEERKKEKNAVMISADWMGEPQFEVCLKESQPVGLIFGFSKKVDKIYVTVDHPEEFLQCVQSVIEKEQAKS